MELIAHRSGPVKYPEQTILSARQALKDGADYVEIDVRLTADGEIAISHDDNANRIFGIDKLVSKMSRTEFLSLRHVKHPAFPAHLLDHYFACRIAPLLIHIKERAVLEPLLNAIDRCGYQKQVVLGVQEPDWAEVVKRHNPDFLILAFMQAPGKVDAFADAGADIIRLWESWVSKDAVKTVKDRGKKVWVMAGACNGFDVGYTSNERLRQFLNNDVDGVLLNDIRSFQKAIEAF